MFHFERQSWLVANAAEKSHCPQNHGEQLEMLHTTAD